MQALVYTAPGKLEIQDWPRAQPNAGEVEVLVESAGICSADITAFLGHSNTRKAPMILGHEAVGRIASGQRVVVDPLTSCGHCRECAQGATNLCSTLRLLGMGETQGSFAEAVAIPQGQLHPISESLDDKLVIWAEPLANIVHLFRLAPLQPSMRIGIVGAGTMGALAVQMALHLGINDVLVLEIDEKRRAAAQMMGASMAINPLQAPATAFEYAGRGLDVVIDACGSCQARHMAFDLCRPAGMVVLLGLADKQSELNFAASIRKEHRVAMSFGYTRDDFVRSLELLSSRAIDLRQWTAEMRLEDGLKAFERMVSSRGDTLKMILRP